MNNTENDGHIGQMMSEIVSHNDYARMFVILLLIVNAISLPFFIFPLPVEFPELSPMVSIANLFSSIIIFLYVFLIGKRLKVVLRLYKEKHSKANIHK